jgi:SAM-dependent methyltransferase
MDREVLRETLALYNGISWCDRQHVWGRLALCPFRQLAAFVPRAGLIVDLGCGHGLFAHALALDALDRHIVGVDPAVYKLEIARAIQPSGSHVYFVQGDVLANPVVGAYQAVLLIDVLYLLDRQQQESVLRMCCDRLTSGGVLLLKTMDDHPRWKVALNQLEEWLAVRVLHITQSGTSGFTFRPLTEWASLCRALGLNVEIVYLHQGYYHPHGAVVGVKK